MFFYLHIVYVFLNCFVIMKSFVNGAVYPNCLNPVYQCPIFDPTTCSKTSTEESSTCFCEELWETHNYNSFCEGNIFIDTSSTYKTSGRAKSSTYQNFIIVVDMTRYYTILCPATYDAKFTLSSNYLKYTQILSPGSVNKILTDIVVPFNSQVFATITTKSGSSGGCAIEGFISITPDTINVPSIKPTTFSPSLTNMPLQTYFPTNLIPTKQSKSPIIQQFPIYAKGYDGSKCSEPSTIYQSSNTQCFYFGAQNKDFWAKFTCFEPTSSSSWTIDYFETETQCLNGVKLFTSSGTGKCDCVSSNPYQGIEFSGYVNCAGVSMDCSTESFWTIGVIVGICGGGIALIALCLAIYYYCFRQTIIKYSSISTGNETLMVNSLQNDEES